MQLHYNILWIDNDLPEYEERGAIQDLKSFLFNLGFEPYVVPLYEDSDIDIYLADTKFDLIISDYQLDNTTGDKIIEHIRDQNILTEILFYSAKINFRDDEQVQNNLKLIDRISFHYGRDTLLQRIEKVVELTLDKLLELNATRGLVTAATSELDVEIEKMVKFLIDTNGLKDEELKSIVEVKVVNPLQKKLEKFWESFESFGTYFHRIDAVKRWEILRDLLKPQKSDEKINAFLKANKTYQDQIIEIRNKFAHAVAVEVDGRMVLKGQLGKEDFEFDQEACVKIRRNIIEHRNQFRLIKEYFGI